MLWLDKAFGGVDGTNKASMFRLLTSCDLDAFVADPAESLAEHFVAAFDGAAALFD